MKWLVIAVLILAQQPAKAPKRERAAKTNGTQVTNQTDATNSQQEPAASPAHAAQSTNTSVMPHDQISGTTKDSQRNEPEDKAHQEDLKIQRKLAWFTGLLVLVGFLQACLMFFQWLTYRRQAGIMEQQRATMHSQWTTMQDQLTQMKDTGKQTDALIAQATVQAEKTGIAAEAAKTSAEAATVSSDIAFGVAIPTLVVHEFDMANAGAASLEAMLQFPSVKLVVKNYGQTPAFLRSWSVVFTCDDLPGIPEYYDHPGSGIVLEKIVVQPNESYTFPDLHTWQRQEFSLDDVQTILEHQKIFNVYGCVCYGDIFGNPIRRLKFCETAINFFGGPSATIGWFGELAPPAYRGTDRMPIRVPAKV